MLLARLAEVMGPADRGGVNRPGESGAAGNSGAVHPARRLLNPITRCRDQPHNRNAGTDDGRGTGQKLDANRLTLMCERSRHNVA